MRSDPRSGQRSDPRSDPSSDPRSDPRFDPRSERTHLICVVVLAGLVCLVVLYVSLCLFFYMSTVNVSAMHLLLSLVVIKAVLLS